MLNRLLSALLLLLVLFGPVWADNGSVVYYGAELPPIVKLDADGRLGGLAVEILLEVARNSGGAIPEPDMQRVPWARALSECRHNPRSAVLGMTMLPSRKPHFKWVGPIAAVPLALYTRTDSGITIGSLAELADYSVGVVRGTAPGSLLSEAQGLGGIKVEQVNSIRSLVLMMRAGRLELTIQSEPCLRYLLHEMKIPRSDFVKVFDLGAVLLYFGFNRHCDDAYIKRLQAGLDALKAAPPGGTSRYEEMCGQFWPLGCSGVCGLPSR